MQKTFPLSSRMTEWKSAIPSWKRPLAFQVVARQGVIDRHIRGGCTPAEAQRKYDRNDGLNANIVLRHVARADWIVELEPTPSLRRS